MEAAPMICAIHDLSGLGRCALTVVIPALSAMGVQVCPVPTAVLSTHTGGFTDMAMRDLTDLIPAYLDHWRALGVRFQAIYSGYLGSEAQADMVAAFCASQPEALYICDPVMGDEGAPYSAISDRMPSEMRALARRADLITPNWTETCLLLERPYRAAPLTDDELSETLTALLRLGPKAAVITGLARADGTFVNAAMEASTGRMRLVPFQRLPFHYPGTGDLFASVLTGALVQGRGLSFALELATQYVYHTVRRSQACPTEARMGVQLEITLPDLFQMFSQNHPFTCLDN